jgi:Fibronectin type III domain
MPQFILDDSLAIPAGTAVPWSVIAVGKNGTKSMAASGTYFPAPSSASVTAKTTSTLQITWSPISGAATAYFCRYKPTRGGTSAYTSCPGTIISPYTITGLTQFTEYDVQVGAVDGSHITLVDRTLLDSFPTGYSTSGVPLAEGNLDPRFSLVSAPDPAFLGSVRIGNIAGTGIAQAWKDPSYTGPTEGISWIGPATATSVNPLDFGCPAGVYTYRTVVDLTDMPEGTPIRVSGSWSCDNIGERILVNGVDNGVPVKYGWSTMQAFILDKGWTRSRNTVDFVVSNWDPPNQMPNPGGLRVSQLLVL